MKLPDGPYFYFPTEKSTIPIVVEIVAGHVSEVGDAHMRPLAHYGGEFTRLIEVVDVDEAQAIDTADEV